MKTFSLLMPRKKQIKFALKYNIPVKIPFNTTDNGYLIFKHKLIAMHNFTPEDLLLYSYNETSPAQTAAIKAALENDWSLREKFEMITSAKGNLETLKLSPSQQTIDNILNYAEKAVSEFSAPV